MKLASILTAVLVTFSAPAVLAHSEHGKPQYGGIYGEAGHFQLELVSKDAQIVIYVTSHGEPLSTKGASGKLTILGSGGKSEVELSPAGDNQLVGKVAAKPAKGSKIVATVSMPGKSPATVRFAIE